MFFSFCHQDLDLHYLHYTWRLFRFILCGLGVIASYSIINGVIKNFWKLFTGPQDIRFWLGSHILNKAVVVCASWQRDSVSSRGIMCKLKCHPSSNPAPICHSCSLFSWSEIATRKRILYLARWEFKRRWHHPWYCGEDSWKLFSYFFR